MKRILFLFAISIVSIIYAEPQEEPSALHTDSAQPDSSKRESEKANLSGEEKDELTLFLLEEVLPAFGGLKELKPSFEMHFNSGGFFLQKCLLKWKIKQSRSIHYNMINDVELYNFRADAEIGQPVFLIFDISCSAENWIAWWSGQQVSEELANVSFSLSFENESQESDFYRLKIKSFDQDQLDIKLWSLQMDAQLERYEQEMILNSDGRLLPVSQVDDHAEQERVQINTQLFLNGSAQLSTPSYYTDGTRKDTPFTVAISGKIFMGEGSFFPMIDISME